MLPYTPGDPQQVERKRHLGNDIVVLVFLDGENDTYSPDRIRSHFNHILCVVSVDRENSKGNAPTHYKMQVARKDGVPPFGPQLPECPVFESGPALRDFLLTKLINGERAALNAPEFHSRLSRTRCDILSSYKNKV